MVQMRMGREEERNWVGEVIFRIFCMKNIYF